MIQMDKPGYIPEEWNESKGMGNSAMDVIPLVNGGKLEMFAEYMIHHYIAYDKQLRVVCYQYSEVATYKESMAKRRLSLYTKEIYHIADLVGDEPIAERILSCIGRQLPTVEDYILSLYGESGALLYPKKQEAYVTDIDIQVYENYLRLDDTIGIHVMPYQNIRVIEEDNESVEMCLITFSVWGETVFGGYTELSMMCNRSSEKKIAHYLKIIQKKIFEKQKKVIVLKNGCGRVVTKPFYRERGEKPLEKPMVLCQWTGATSLLTFYADCFVLKKYFFSVDTPSGDEYVVPYQNIQLVGCKSRKLGYNNITVYEIAITAQGESAPLLISATGTRGREGYQHIVDLLKKHAPNAFVR